MIPSPPPPGATAPLRIARFRTLWLASVFSNVGQFLQAVAAAWLMLELTGSPLWVGLMVASPTLPLLFFALPAGALADLVDRRHIMIASQALQAVAALAMALLWFTGLLTPALLLAMGLLLGVGMAFTMPAWQAMVPDLVPRGLVAGAVALNSAGFNVARAVGPALGGLIVATAGPGAAFTLNAVSYLAVMVAIASFRGGTWHDDVEPSLSAAIATGLRYVRFTASYRWLLLVAALFALTSAAVQALLPSMTQDAMGGGATLYGALLGAMGVGALAGAFTRPRVSRWLRGRLVPVGVTLFGVCGITLGVSRLLPLTLVALTGAGAAWVWTLATLNATTQMLTPAWVRGRTMSVYMLAFLGLLPIGSILAGAAGDLLGAPLAVVISSVGVVALGLSALRLPLPVLEDVVPPEAPVGYEPLPHPTAVKGDRVMVVSTWVIDENDLADFFAVMAELRLVRLRTGAFRWRLYRNVDDPHRMTEVFVLSSWDQHLRQHRRLDAEAVRTLERARAFDRADGPVTRHLVAIDMADPADRPVWDELAAVHADLHRTDGSIPMPGPDVPVEHA
jgi:MFS family permease